jgi:hypothetical protein
VPGALVEQEMPLGPELVALVQVQVQELELEPLVGQRVVPVL